MPRGADHRYLKSAQASIHATTIHQVVRVRGVRKVAGVTDLMRYGARVPAEAPIEHYVVCQRPQATAGSPTDVAHNENDNRRAVTKHPTGI